MKENRNFYCVLAIILLGASYEVFGEELGNKSEPVNADVTPASIILKKCKPTSYPVESIKRGEEGKVQVKILIDATGSVKEAIILKSSGYKLLDEETIRYFSACKYSPAIENSVPINVWQAFEYNWKIEQGRRSTWKP